MVTPILVRISCDASDISDLSRHRRIDPESDLFREVSEQCSSQRDSADPGARIPEQPEHTIPQEFPEIKYGSLDIQG
jgi:hypothetical protein